MTLDTLYIAGASAELERVGSAMHAASLLGYTVTSEWIAEVAAARASGYATDAALPDRDRLLHATQDLSAVDESRILWLLSPVRPSTGAWFEAGYFLALRSRDRSRTWIVSGGTSRGCLFTALADHVFPSDAGALDWLREHAGREVRHAAE